jgi:hypothetical protein
MPDRDGDGSDELIVLLSTVTDPTDARADELAAVYHQRWERETGHDQLKPSCADPGRSFARGCRTWSTRRSGPT